MNAESDPPRLPLPGRADIMSILSRMLWPTRSARAQREAGEASAEHAVHLTDAEPSPNVPDSVDTAPTTEVDAPAIPTTEADSAGPDSPDSEDATAEATAKVVESARAAADKHAISEFVADPQAAAFFDVDNTLVQGASIILLARGLAKHKFFTTSDLLGMAWTQIKFRISGTENADDVASGREKALGFVKGRKVSEIAALSEEVFDAAMLDRIWPGTQALAQMHLDAGQQVWLVTATPVELARVIASRLGLSGALGTVAENHDGAYTGRLVGDILHGPGKAHAVRALAEAEGFDLDKCYAYSDSHNDLPMLSIVGNAVAINPDSKLRSVARDRGWEIKDFRTVRKAAKRAVPGVLAVGALGGATAAARTQRGGRLLRKLSR